MSTQLTFDLPHRPAMERDDFFVSPANAAAVNGVENWRKWPRAKVILVGPEGAGKSHLAHVWAAMTQADVVPAHEIAARAEALSEAAALAVEDADRMAGDAALEEALFHLHNALGNREAPLLITARTPPSAWGLHLPDLASRMAQAGLLQLPPPDDALLLAVMAKLAHDRSLAVSGTALNYALSRIERSFATAARFIDALDHAAITEQRSPNRDLARAVLSRLDEA